MDETPDGPDDQVGPAAARPDQGPRAPTRPSNIYEFLKHVLKGYEETLPTDRRHLLHEFTPIDAARKVVGVGSVGTRCFVLLLLGRDGDDPFFLQVKEATASVLESASRAVQVLDRRPPRRRGPAADPGDARPVPRVVRRARRDGHRAALLRPPALRREGVRGDRRRSTRTCCAPTRRSAGGRSPTPTLGQVIASPSRATSASPTPSTGRWRRSRSPTSHATARTTRRSSTRSRRGGSPPRRRDLAAAAHLAPRARRGARRGGGGLRGRHLEAGHRRDAVGALAASSAGSSSCTSPAPGRSATSPHTSRSRPWSCSGCSSCLPSAPLLVTAMPVALLAVLTRPRAVDRGLSCVRTSCRGDRGRDRGWHRHARTGGGDVGLIVECLGRGRRRHDADGRTGAVVADPRVARRAPGG